MPETFDSLDPSTGAVVGTHRVGSPADVAEAVATARDAASWWGAQGFAGRRRVLDAWRAALVRRMDELADVVRAETGKPHADAVLEIALAIEHLAWAASNARRVLGEQRVSSGLLMANQRASVAYRPLGVVGVIGPWNYPVFTPMGSIAYALAAGNTVVFKPSELTPGVGRWLAQSLADVEPDHRLLQVLTGLGPTGAALAASPGLGKLAFTGSTATGRTVMAAAAEHLTPVVIEAGGKDAMIVDEDADIGAAADAAVWGAMSNAGQTCIGIERAYVHERVYDRFVAEVQRVAGGLHAGPAATDDLGPITMAPQVQVIADHVRDALDRGGRAVVGGPDAVGERFVQPTVLLDVPEDSRAVTEETFGPTLTITAVATMDDAVARTNATSYGLGGAVFSRRRGAELAARMRSGMTSVNAVISFAAVPALPFGGVGGSGFGRIHGADGLREFTYAHAVTRQVFALPLQVTTFTRTPAVDRAFAGVVWTLHGDGPGTLRGTRDGVRRLGRHARRLRP